jgi:hypothetical protein
MCAKDVIVKVEFCEKSDQERQSGKGKFGLPAPFLPPEIA